MSSASRQLRSPALWLCLGLLLHGLNPAALARPGQDEPLAMTLAGGRIPVQVIAGRLVAACEISTTQRRIPVNLFLEFDRACGLELHNQAAAGIGAELDDGTPREIRVHFPTFELKVARRSLGDEEVLKKFTKWHSSEIGENALVGTLGAQVLADWHAVIDLREGFVELTTPRPRTAEPPPVPPGTEVIEVRMASDLVWIPIGYGVGEGAVLAFGTSRWDTLVDERECEARGALDGDLGPLRLGTSRMGSWDLAEFVATRPAPVQFVHPDGALGLVGLGLLQHFRVELDRVNRRSLWTQTEAAKFPVADREFFRALVDDERAPLLAYLTRYPDSRCAPEAAERLLDLCIGDLAPDEEFAAALEWRDRTRQADLRTTEALETIKLLRQAGAPQHVPKAGELGVAAGREDRYPDAVHQVHAALGEHLLEAGDGLEAWKHLLSAAFGLPEDGRINLNLGRYYEQEGRLRRAFSRYVQAVIRPESGPQAIEALARVQPLLGDEDRFSVDLIERMIAGKVLNFGAAVRYAPEDDSAVERVVVSEFFTNGHLSPLGIGGPLAREGLLSHFTGEHLAALTYHFEGPQLDPLTNALAARTAGLYEIEGPTHLVNGRVGETGAARARQKEKLYNAYRDAVLAELERPTDFELQLEVEVGDSSVVAVSANAGGGQGGQVVRGELEVRGPERAGTRIEVILVERGVLFPGKNGVVVHRMLARAALTDELDGAAWEPVDGAQTLTFERDLLQVAAENERYLAEREAAGAGLTPRVSMAIDPGQVTVVALLRDERTHEVLQAARFDIDDGSEAQ